MCNSRARRSPAVTRRAHVIASANFLFQRRGSATGGAETSLSAIRWNIYGRLHVGLYTGERRTDGQKVENVRARARARTRTHGRWWWSRYVRSRRTTITACTSMIGRCNALPLLSPGGTHLRSRKAARSFPLVDWRLPATARYIQKERIKHTACADGDFRAIIRRYADDVRRCRYRAICWLPNRYYCGD